MSHLADFLVEEARRAAFELANHRRSEFVQGSTENPCMVFHGGTHRITRYQCGLYSVERGSFLYSDKHLSDVHSEPAFGPVDDFGRVFNLTETAQDALDVSLYDGSGIQGHF